VSVAGKIAALLMANLRWCWQRMCRSYVLCIWAMWH